MVDLCFKNKMEPAIINGKQVLNKNVFQYNANGTNCVSSSYSGGGGHVRAIIVDRTMSYVWLPCAMFANSHFGKNSYNNMFQHGCYNMEFGENYQNDKFVFLNKYNLRNGELNNVVFVKVQPKDSVGYGYSCPLANYSLLPYEVTQGYVINNSNYYYDYIPQGNNEVLSL